MAARGNETWNVQQTDAKRALAEDTYDDCTSCRVTGIDLSRRSIRYLYTNASHRVRRIRWTRCLQLLHGDEQSTETRTGNHVGCNQVQDGLAEVGHCDYIGHVGRHGDMEGS